MNQEVKKLWIEALRSGKYKQGRDFLSKKGKCCAIGVLCEVAVEKGIVEKMDLWSQIYYNGLNLDCPEKVRNWAGIDRGFAAKIVNLNDRFFAPFSEIADYIEKWEGHQNESGN